MTSEKLEAGKAAHVSADIAGVKKLELLTEDAGEGNRSAWSIWCDPVLGLSVPMDRTYRPVIPDYEAAMEKYIVTAGRFRMWWD